MMTNGATEVTLRAMAGNARFPEEVPGLDPRLARKAMTGLRRVGLAGFSHVSGWYLTDNGRLYLAALLGAAPVPAEPAAVADPGLAWIIGQIPQGREPFPRHRRELVVGALAAWLDLIYGAQDDAEDEAGTRKVAAAQ